MKVIIVGAGEVGFQVAKYLSYENVEVVLIDRDRDKLKRVLDEMDVAVIEGEGSDLNSLKDAGADSADILLAVTNSDETNMIACLLAKAMFKIPRKIARIRNPDYFQNEKLLSKDNLDINPAINPELEVAKAIMRLLDVPKALDVEDFEDGIVRVVGVRLQEGSSFIGKSLRDIGRIAEKRFLIGMLEREDKVIIPTGEDIIKRGDIVYIPVIREELYDILSILGIETVPAESAMIVGGGRIGTYIASALESRMNIKIIEQDIERCKFLSRTLKKTLVLHGDGVDQKLLLEENAGDMEAFVAVSNNDELNIMASLLAKKVGAKKTITIVNRTDYIPLARELGLETVLSPRLITANTILKYVRRGDILSLTTIADRKAEILETKIGEGSKLSGKLLRDIKMPRSSLIGAIIRDKKVIIPTGSDFIYENDRVIVFTLREAIKSVEDFL